MSKVFNNVALFVILIALITACNPSQITFTELPKEEGDDEGVGTISPGTEAIPVDGRGERARVLWTVSKYVLGKDFTGNEDDAKAMLFKELDIEDTQIIFGKDVCDAVSFDESTVKTADYLEEKWNETPEHLGIDSEEIKVIKTQCSLFGFQEYMRLDDGQLVVPYNGVFYFFEPAISK